MDIVEIRRDNFLISTDPEKLNLKSIHHFLSQEAYWSKNIPFETVEKAAANSLNFGVYEVEKQIGYARVISDYATIAYLGDVYVLPEYRGKGLSKWLIATVMKHPKLQQLRRWILLTGDAHELYKQFGWTSIAAPDRWMELHNKSVYSQE